MADDKEDDLVWDFAAMLSSSKRTSWRDYVTNVTKHLIAFLQDNNLCKQVYWERSKDLPSNLVVWKSDLTELGQQFVIPALNKWLQKHDRGGTPEDTSILKNALTKARRGSSS